MAFRENDLSVGGVSWPPRGDCPPNRLGTGTAEARPVVKAGSGACSKCGCTAFESGGANEYQCGNTSCAHAWGDHY